MKILLPFSLNHRGGSYHSARDIITSFNRSDDIRFTVATPRDSEEKTEFFESATPLIIYYQLSNKQHKRLANTAGSINKIKSIFSQYKVYTEAKKILKNTPFDLVHINDDLSIIPWGFAARKFQIPVIWHIRQGSGHQYLDKIRLKIASAIIFNSEFSKTRFQNKQIQNIPNTVIYNIVNRPNPFEKKQLKSQSRLKIAFIGSLIEIKRLEWFLDLIRDVSVEFDNLEFLIAGKDYSNGKYIKDINEIKNKFGSKAKISYHGYIADINLMYKEIDMLLVPSKMETFGRTIVEAMYHKIPVVACNTGAIPELIDNGINGFLVDVDDYDDFLTKTKLLILDSNLKNKIGQSGYDFAFARFDFKKTTQKLYDFYKYTKGEKDVRKK